MIFNSFFVAIVEGTKTFFTSGSEGNTSHESSISPFLLKGYLSLTCNKKVGPFNHFNVKRALGLSPCDASSAGLHFNSTYFHWSTELASSISWTQLATKTWNLRLSFVMYPKTTLRSNQKNSGTSLRLSSWCIWWLTFKKVTAACHSRREFVTGLRGVTRDLPATKEQWILPASFWNLR